MPVLYEAARCPAGHPLTEFKTPLNFGSFGKGRWAAALRKAGAVSELYIRRHSREPALLADAVAHLVHSTQPPRHLDQR